MADPSVLYYDGIEISNAHRVLAYLNNCELGDCQPSFLAPHSCGCIGDDIATYTDPATDEAPWYDASVPESADFLGVYLTRVTGLDGSPLNRRLSRSASGVGGSLGRLNLGPREMIFSGFLFAQGDGCALDYGRRWLTEVVKGCNGNLADMCVRTCCPETVDPYEPDEGIKTLFRVGLVDAPDFQSPVGRCARQWAQVTWTMAAEVPWLYDDLVSVETPLEFDVETATCIAICDPACTETEGPCDDPSVDIGGGFCEPWWATAATCVQIPAQPDWLEAATVLTVWAGDTELTNLVIKVFDNHSGAAAATYEDDAVSTCSRHCSVIGVKGLPADTRLVIDARKRQVDLICPGGIIAPGEPYVSGEFGSVPWIEIACDPVVLCAYASGEGLAANAHVDVAYALRRGG